MKIVVNRIRLKKKFKQWQDANGKSTFEMPYGNAWYLDKRVEAIRLGLLTRAHCDDLVKSYLASRVRAAKKAAESSVSSR